MKCALAVMLPSLSQADNGDLWAKLSRKSNLQGRCRFITSGSSRNCSRQIAANIAKLPELLRKA
jgi:hypothetical protein